MKFYIKSDKFIGFFKNPNKIEIGDIIYADALKYSDPQFKNFIGYSYANYFVVDSKQLGENIFKVKASSQRVLEFDGRGVITTSGTSEQIFTLDNNGKIIDSKVLKNNLAITGGTGEFISTCGEYHIKTVENMLHVGKIDIKCGDNHKYATMLSFFLIFLLFLIIFLRK